MTVHEQPGDTLWWGGHVGVSSLVPRPSSGLALVATLRALRVWSASQQESERRGGQGHPPVRVLAMAGALLTSSFFFRSFFFFCSPGICLQVPPSWTSVRPGLGPALTPTGRRTGSPPTRRLAGRPAKPTAGQRTGSPLGSRRPTTPNQAVAECLDTGLSPFPRLKAVG